MKICFITNYVHPTKGGSKKYLFEIMNELKKQGHKVTLVSYDSGYPDNFVDEIIYMKSLPVPIIGNSLNTIFIGLFSFFKTMGKDYEIFCFESGFMGIWALLFKLRKKPTVTFSMRYGLNLLKLNLRNYNSSLKSLPMFFFNYVIWEIIFFINEFMDVLISDKIIVLNDEAKDVWLRHNIKPSKIEIIPFGTDLEKYKPLKKDKNLQKELEIEKEYKILLYVGHLEFSRNIDQLILAFPMITEKIKDQPIKLVVVGSGLMKEQIHQMVKRTRLEDKIIFLNHIHDENKLNKIYNIADLLILPQVPGTSSILAVSAGTPVATIHNTKGLLAAVDQKILNNFFYFDSSKPESIAEGCYYLIKHPEILESMSKNGLEIIKDYSWNKITFKFINCLENI